MLHSGIEERKVSNLLSTVSIPPCSKAKLKKREKEMSQAVEDIACSSCADAELTEEKISQSNLKIEYSLKNHVKNGKCF